MRKPALIRKAAKRLWISVEGPDNNDTQHCKFSQVVNLVKWKSAAYTPTLLFSDNESSSFTITPPLSLNKFSERVCHMWENKVRDDSADNLSEREEKYTALFLDDWENEAETNIKTYTSENKFAWKARRLSKTREDLQKKTSQLKEDKIKVKNICKENKCPPIPIYFTIQLYQGQLQNKSQKLRNNITSCCCDRGTNSKRLDMLYL